MGPKTKQTVRKYGPDGLPLATFNPPPPPPPLQPPVQPAGSATQDAPAAGSSAGQNIVTTAVAGEEVQARKGVLNPQESADHVAALTGMAESFIRIATSVVPKDGLYRELVDAIKTRCEKVDYTFSETDVDAVVSSVTDTKCALLRAIPEEPEGETPLTSAKKGRYVTVVEGSEVPEGEEVLPSLAGLRPPIKKDTKERIESIFRQLGEARALEGLAFENLAALSGEVTPEQFMTISTLATSVPCQVHIAQPPTTRKDVAKSEVVKQKTRVEQLREAILPRATQGNPLSRVPQNHDTRVLAAVVAYKLLKALREPTSIAKEAEEFGVKYNRLEKMLTAARYRGGGQIGYTPKQRLKRKKSEPVDPLEEQEEEQQALHGPTEPREQPPRKAKGSPDKKKRKQAAAGEQTEDA